MKWTLSRTCRRKSPLYLLKRLTEQLGGAKVYLKRKILLHTGAHRASTIVVLGQICVGKRMG